jgi:integrase
MFPIDNAMRQGAIDYARRVVVGVNESVSDPSLSLQQALRRLRYVMERFGVTRAGLGVVPHGLRHQGAADDYRAMTGELPPVAGVAIVDRELDAQARQCIAERLGHGRRQIVNAYLGSRSATRPKVEADQETQRLDEHGDQA